VDENVFPPRQRLAHELEHGPREGDGRVFVLDVPPVARDVEPVVLLRFVPAWRWVPASDCNGDYNGLKRARVAGEKEERNSEFLSTYCR
jgi:hypothetical protein